MLTIYLKTRRMLVETRLLRDSTNLQYGTLTPIANHEVTQQSINSISSNTREKLAYHGIWLNSNGNPRELRVFRGRPKKKLSTGDDTQISCPVFYFYDAFHSYSLVEVRALLTSFVPMRDDFMI